MCEEFLDLFETEMRESEESIFSSPEQSGNSERKKLRLVMLGNR